MDEFFNSDLPSKVKPSAAVYPSLLYSQKLFQNNNLTPFIPNTIVVRFDDARILDTVRLHQAILQKKDVQTLINNFFKGFCAMDFESDLLLEEKKTNYLGFRNHGVVLFKIVFINTNNDLISERVINIFLTHSNKNNGSGAISLVDWNGCQKKQFVAGKAFFFNTLSGWPKKGVVRGFTYLACPQIMHYVASHGVPFLNNFFSETTDFMTQKFMYKPSIYNTNDMFSNIENYEQYPFYDYKKF